jgi:hypothetical protein
MIRVKQKRGLWTDFGTLGIQKARGKKVTSIRANRSSRLHARNLQSKINRLNKRHGEGTVQRASLGALEGLFDLGVIRKIDSGKDQIGNWIQASNWVGPFASNAKRQYVNLNDVTSGMFMRKLCNEKSKVDVSKSQKRASRRFVGPRRRTGRI